MLTRKDLKSGGMIIVWSTFVSKAIFVQALKSCRDRIESAAAFFGLVPLQRSALGILMLIFMNVVCPWFNRAWAALKQIVISSSNNFER